MSKGITNEELALRVDKIVDEFSQEVETILKRQSEKGFIAADDPDRSELLALKVLESKPGDILSGYVMQAGKLPEGNFLLYFVKKLDFKSFQDLLRASLLSGKVSRKRARQDSAQCLCYIRKRRKECEKYERLFLGAFVTCIKMRAARDQF